LVDESEKSKQPLCPRFTAFEQLVSMLPCNTAKALIGQLRLRDGRRLRTHGRSLTRAVEASQRALLLAEQIEQACRSCGCVGFSATCTGHGAPIGLIGEGRA